MAYTPIGEFQGSEDWSSRIIHPGPDLSLFLQAGNGAIARRLHEKVAAILSPMDFGAVGDGIANDQAMFALLEAAFPISRDVDLEGRIYLVTTLPAGHRYKNGTFRIGATLYPADPDDQPDQPVEIPAGSIQASHLSSVALDLQAITDKLAGTGKAAFLSSTASDLQAITNKLAGTGKAGFLSSVQADLQAITDKLAGTVKAATLSNVTGDLQAITDKLAGTVKAATLTNDATELAAIATKLGVSTGGGGITVVTAATLSNVAADLEAITTKLRYKGPNTGEVSVTLPTMINDGPIDVRRFGVTLNGTTDDTTAWNLALASGRNLYFPEGSSRITNRLSFSGVEGQCIVGENRNCCNFIIPSTFSSTATAVIQWNAAFQGLRDVNFRFTQPSTTVRTSLKQYPPAIDLNGHSRAEVHRIKVENGWVGIRAQGNCGGAIIDDVQMGTFYQGIVIDGALDSIRIDRYHFWPFGIVNDANTIQIFGDGQNVSLDVGRADDLNIGSILSYEGRIRFSDYGSGAHFGVASRITLDSQYARIEFAAGELAIGELYGSTNVANDYKISQTGGELKISGLSLEGAVALTNPMVYINGTGAKFFASNIHCQVGAGFSVFRLLQGIMHLSNGFLYDGSGVNRSEAMIYVTGGRAIITGMRTADVLNANQYFIRIDNDDHHVITGNSFLGWKYQIPTQINQGVYGPNLGVQGGLVGPGSTELVSPVKVKKLTGTLNASGSVSLAHSITGGAAVGRVLSLSAHFADANGLRVNCDAGMVMDNTNVIVSAGASGANRPVVVIVTYD